MDAFLVVRSGMTDRRQYRLVGGKSYLVGRSREADIIVKDRLASRNHCRIASSGEEWTVADLGSSNGTYVNRQRVTTHALRDGDVLQIGGAAIEFRLAAKGAAPPAQAPPAAEHTPAPPHEQAPPSPQLEPRPEPPGADEMADEEDLRDLFEFLDRIEKGETPSAASQPAEQPAPPPDAPDKEEGAPGDDDGGLLGFLRRKKKQP